MADARERLQRNRVQAEDLKAALQYCRQHLDCHLASLAQRDGRRLRGVICAGYHEKARTRPIIGLGFGRSRSRRDAGGEGPLAGAHLQTE